MRKILFIISVVLLAMPVRAQQEMYDKYAERSDVLVAIARQHPVAGGDNVDAILFRALDNEGWNWMQKEFGLEYLVQAQQTIQDTTMRRVILTRRKDDLTQDAPRIGGDIDYGESSLVVLDIEGRTLCAFYFESKQQYESIIINSNKKNQP